MLCYLPEHSTSDELASRFQEYFSDKIVKLRTQLDSAPGPSGDLPEVEEVTPPSLDILDPTTPDEVRKIITESKATSSSLDPIPTPFLKVFIEFLLPILTHIINISFKVGTVPGELKMALIIPLLKKLGLDLEVLKNVRPVSNLPYLSKLLERVAAKRLLHHMGIHGLHELFQSSYKALHSTETALLRIQTDVLTALDNQKCVLLVMLDLSSAFDTIDHSVLLSRLKSTIGLSGKALDWFISYLSNRMQSILINGTRSRLWELLFGVPQGSVLGPILFIIYTSPLGKILKALGVGYHFYADDSQIYISFNLDDSDAAVRKVQEVINIIKSWMQRNFLCLNDDKTEILVISSRAAHKKLNIPHIQIGSENIVPTSQAKNIGFYFDQFMDCKKHIQTTCQGAWFQLKKIGRIRKYLDQKSTERLIHAFVTSRLDINNSLLYGLPDALLLKLQRVQNATARMVTLLPKHSHITPVLADLHWLPVTHRIDFKVILLVFKALNELAPKYLTDLLTKKPSSTRSLRSNDQNLLIVPKTRTVTYGDRSFNVVGPKLWNSLPVDMRCCDDLNTFKKLLKTLLYRKAFE